MFPKEPINWPLKKWQIILWSDKSKIVLSGTCQCQKSVTNSLQTPVYFTGCEAQWNRCQYLGLFFILWSWAYILKLFLQNITLPYVEYKMLL